MIPSFIDPYSIRKAYATTLATTNPVVIHDLYVTARWSYDWFLLYVNARQFIDDKSELNFRLTLLNINYVNLSSDSPVLGQSSTQLQSMYYPLGIVPINYFGGCVSFRYDLGTGTTQTCQSELVYGLPYVKRKKTKWSKK